MKSRFYFLYRPDCSGTNTGPEWGEKGFVLVVSENYSLENTFTNFCFFFKENWISVKRKAAVKPERLIREWETGKCTILSNYVLCVRHFLKKEKKYLSSFPFYSSFRKKIMNSELQLRQERQREKMSLYLRWPQSSIEIIC